jgi:Cation transporting ATPase, C-terminus
MCLQLLAVYLAPLAQVLDLTRLTSADWVIVVASIIAPVILVELTKLLARRKRHIVGNNRARS